MNVFNWRPRSLLRVAAALALTLALGACCLGSDSCKDDNKPAQPTQTTQTVPPAPTTQAPPQTTQAQPRATPATPTVAPVQVVEGEAQLTKNFYVILDGSGSMNDCPPATERQRNCKPKIVGAKEALTAMVNSLPDDVNLGFFVFDNKGYRELLPLAKINKQAFLQALGSVRANNGTPLGEAIQQGVKVLHAQQEKQLGYGEFRLVVVTDGDANGKVPLTVAVADARKVGVPIFTIGFGIGNDHELHKYSLKYWAADTDSDVRNALQEAISEIDFDDKTAPK